jgi:UDP-N-acetylmuramoylalanine--D-glutamate ligase
MEIKGKKVTIVGLGRSGVGAANLLSELCADVTVTDIKTEEELKNFLVRIIHPVTFALGGHPEDVFMSADMVIVSPGVPLDILALSKARDRGVPIIGELELAYRIFSDQQSAISSNPPLHPLEKGAEVGFLAVTGTNGKSTTTALLDFMLRKSAFRTILGGNIGIALTEEIYKIVTSNGSRVKSKNKIQNSELNSSLVNRHLPLDFIVTEVSSFQLESIRDFRPKGSVILNVTPDHLDRYHSFAEYCNAKARIFENQGEGDFLVLNADDPEVVKVLSEKLKPKSEKPRIFYFSRKREVEGIYSREGRVYCNFPDSSLLPRRMNLSFHSTGQAHHSLLINAEEIRIKGVHNLENAMAASAMALLAGSPLDAVRDSLREFPGLEHRLEFVREIEGVRYFNDSKGTNVGAVVKSLESFEDPIILIAGGRDKAGDFSILRDLVKERVKAIVLIGEAAEKIKRSLGDLTETIMAKSMQKAVEISRSISMRGNVVLLSPACASFDMFTDFEDRGRQFKKIVMGMN